MAPALLPLCPCVLRSQCCDFSLSVKTMLFFFFFWMASISLLSGPVQDFNFKLQAGVYSVHTHVNG
jgi:hypothetical protein